MKLCWALVALLCHVSQAVGAPVSDDTLSCSQAKFEEVALMCNCTMCDSTKTELLIENERLCGYRCIKYLERSMMRPDTSFEELERREAELKPCSNYTKIYSLLSKDGAVIEGPYKKEETVPAQAPPAVQNLAASVDEAQNIFVDFQRPETQCYIQGYGCTYKYTDLTTLQEYAEEQHQFSPSHDNDEVKYQISNAKDNVLYEICVTAFVGELEGPNKCVKARTPERAASPQPPPRQLDLLDSTSTSLKVTWLPPETGIEVNNYELSVVENKNAKAPVTKHTVPTDDLPYTINNLLPGIKYKILIQAVTTLGLSSELVGEYSTEKEKEADKPQADKPQADKPQADKPQADNPQADKLQADKPQDGKPQTDKPQAGQPQADQVVVEEFVSNLAKAETFDETQKAERVSRGESVSPAFARILPIAIFAILMAKYNV